MEHTKRPHTTGRLSSRMTQQEKDKLEQRLHAYAFKQEDLQNFPRVELEMGMGNGLALLERAKKDPNSLFIGCEIYQNGLRSLVFRLEQQPEITNVRIVPQDARDLLVTLPEESIQRLCIFYPDPWPKKKHHKRRLMQHDLLTELHRTLEPEGELWFVSDIPDYVFYTLTQAYTHGAFQPVAMCPSQWATAPAWWVSTKYEQKALREGRKPWYLLFSNNS